MKSFLCVLTVLSLTAASAWADFSYEQSSQIVGGMAAAAMKLAGAFSKKAREPIKSITLVKGNRMATVHSDSATIIDLDKQTITEVDFGKRTYSVMTFAEMKQAMEEASKKLKSDAKMQVNASIKETGQTKVIAGQKARQVIVTVEMESTDPKTNQQGTMVVTSDMWLAPAVPGYGEIRAFYERMAKTVNWFPEMSFGAAAGPSARGMQGLMRESAKLDGIPVLQIVRMGMKGEAVDETAIQQMASSEQPQVDVKGAAAESAAGAIAGGLAGRLGGLGGLGRRKKTETKAEEKPAPAAQPAAQTPKEDLGVPGAPASLMIVRTEMTGFSSAVDASKLEVPAGFKQTPSEKLKRVR